MSTRIKRRQAIDHIRNAWYAERFMSSIVMDLLCLGYPMTRDQILEVMRAIIFYNSENRNPKAGDWNGKWPG